MTTTTTTTTTQPAKDNLLGICNAIGEDFGFNPLWLRVPLAATIMVSPLGTLIAYGAMGLAVLASRLIVRSPRKPKPQRLPAPTSIRAGDCTELALAA